MTSGDTKSKIGTPIAMAATALAVLCSPHAGVAADNEQPILANVANVANVAPATIGNAAILSPSVLEDSGARINSIVIARENIFNPEDPRENRWFHRLANAWHVTTKPEVIRTQLLFEPGDRYNQQVLEESERLLRSNRYLREATIVATKYENGAVDLEVHTSDVWTLSPSVSFGRGGGKNSGGIGIKEHNLLGSGASIGIGYKSNVDRDTVSLRYFDRNFLSSRYQLTGEYTDASDGFTERFQIEQPFFALDTRQAGGVTLGRGRRTESLYDSGDIAAQFDYRFDEHEVYYGWSKGLQHNWSRRTIAGLAYNAANYAPLGNGEYPVADIPADRRFVYPYFGLEWLQDDYVTTRDFDQMNRTEDRHLGMRASLRLGYASESLGSSASAWIYGAKFADTLYRSAKSTVVVNAELNGRVENGQSRNAQLLVSGRYDRRQSEKRLLHVSLSATAGNNLDLENTVYIGGDSGLRGYPLRYQAGDSSVLFTVEQRLFTDWYPFRLFNVGGAAFFDAGRTWGADPVSGQHLGWLKNVGVGLRIGSTRSSVGRMVHIDLAYPLDGGSDISNVQLLVQSRKGF